MTVYNAATHLQETLDSLTAQKYQRFEVIVLEHGSTDKSLKILKDWKDPRLKLETLTQNIGRTPALNRCLSRANGEFVAILDADDLSDPWRIQAQVDFLTLHPEIGLVGTWCKIVDEGGKRIGATRPSADHEGLTKELAVRNPIAHSSMMYRREIALEIGGYDESFTYAQDCKLLISFAMSSKLAVIKSELCSVRKTATSLSQSEQASLTRASDEYRLFRAAGNDLKFVGTVRLLNRKQQMLTLLILIVKKFKSRMSSKVRKS